MARVVAQRSHRPLAPWAFSGEPSGRDELRVEVGRSALPDLKEGEAIVRVVAERAPTWLRHPGPVVKELRLPVRLVPPALALLSSQHYVSQGGSGVVVYRVGAQAVRDGVRAGTWFFPGAPLPGGGKEDRLALFGVPWDLSDEAALRVVAEDDAGNEAELAFVDRFFPKPPARDRIALDDAFLAKVVTEIRQQTPGLEDRGSLILNYLEINRDLRKRNADELVALAPRSAGAFLWTEPFAPLRNAQVMSHFADQRTYVYQGREVDAADAPRLRPRRRRAHEVPAANPGVVVLARYFGIYGNTVVVDHGRGLATLYAHLSSIEAKEGQKVERGEVLGRTGATGLAGGDHLHFTTLVRGLPVDGHGVVGRGVDPRPRGVQGGAGRPRLRRPRGGGGAASRPPRASPLERAQLAVDLGEGLADLLAADLARGHRLLPFHLGSRETQGVDPALALRIGRRDALPLLLLLALGHPLLEAVFGVDQSFTGVTHRAS